MKNVDVDVMPSPTTRNMNNSIERTPSANADDATPLKRQKEKPMKNTDIGAMPSPMTRNVNNSIERTPSDVNSNRNQAGFDTSKHYRLQSIGLII